MSCYTFFKLTTKCVCTVLYHTLWHNMWCHMASSYFVSRRIAQGGDDEPLEREIYFWLGQSSSTDERGTAAYKTVELDDYFDGSCGRTRESSHEPLDER